MTRLAGVKADQPYSHRGLEAVAKHVREVLKLKPAQAVDALQLFESLDDITVECAGKEIPLNYRVVDLEDSEGCARYVAQDKCIEVVASANTYNRLERGQPRAGFFVGHELGHCILHARQLMRLAQMPTNKLAALHRGSTTHKPYEDTEWQANGFSGALFMPAQGLQVLEQRFGQLSAAMIQETFKVSYEAAGIRQELFAKRKGELL